MIWVDMIIIHEEDYMCYCSQKLLLNMLDNHCIHCNEQIATLSGHQPLSSYDFVYLPIDFKYTIFSFLSLNLCIVD